MGNPFRVEGMCYRRESRGCMKRLLHAPTVIKRCPFQGQGLLMFRRLEACVPGDACDNTVLEKPGHTVALL